MFTAASLSSNALSNSCLELLNLGRLCCSASLKSRLAPCSVRSSPVSSPALARHKRQHHSITTRCWGHCQEKRVRTGHGVARSRASEKKRCSPREVFVRNAHLRLPIHDSECFGKRVFDARLESVRKAVRTARRGLQSFLTIAGYPEGSAKVLKRSKR